MRGVDEVELNGAERRANRPKMLAFILLQEPGCDGSGLRLAC